MTGLRTSGGLGGQGANSLKISGGSEVAVPTLLAHRAFAWLRSPKQSILLLGSSLRASQVRLGIEQDIPGPPDSEGDLNDWAPDFW